MSIDELDTSQLLLLYLELCREITRRVGHESIWDDMIAHGEYDNAFALLNICISEIIT